MNEMQFYLWQRGILIQDDDTIDDSDNDDTAFPLHSDLEVYEKKSNQFVSQALVLP